MAIADLIQERIQKLPASVQAEVLDFVEYLVAKAMHRDEEDWSELSLTLAMRGMESETAPAYTAADLKVAFR